MTNCGSEGHARSRGSTNAVLKLSRSSTCRDEEQTWVCTGVQMQLPKEDGCAASCHAQHHPTLLCLSRSLICPELPRIPFSDAVYAPFIVPNILDARDKYRINPVSFCAKLANFGTFWFQVSRVCEGKSLTGYTPSIHPVVHW